MIASSASGDKSHTGYGPGEHAARQGGRPRPTV